MINTHLKMKEEQKFSEIIGRVKYTPQHICQQEGGRQGLKEEPCQMAAVEALPAHHSRVP